MASTEYSFQVLHTPEDFIALRPGWDRLFGQLSAPAFYQDWRWYDGLTRWLFPDIAFYCIYLHGELVAVVPLRPLKAGWSLQIPVCKQTDLVDILLHPDHCNEAVMDALLQAVAAHFGRWQKLVFERVRGDSLAYQLAQTHRGFLHTDVMSRNTFFHTQNTESLTALSKKHLKNVKRFQRKLAKEIGDPLFEHLRSDKQSVEDFLTIEDSGWKGKQGKRSSILSDPKIAEFYRDVAAAFAETGQLSLSFASVNQQRISGQFAIVTGAQQSLLKVSYRSEYQDYSPGNLLLNDTLHKAALGTEVEEVNLVTGPEWADRWHPNTTEVYQLTLYSRTLWGWLGYGFCRLKDYLRPFKHRLMRRRAG